MAFCLDPSCRNQSYIVQVHRNVGLAIVQAYSFSNTFKTLGYFSGKTRGRGILIDPANIFLTFWESNRSFVPVNLIIISMWQVIFNRRGTYLEEFK